MISAEPVNFDLPNRKIRGLSWGDSSKPPLVAVHGWLDNAESFYLLAEHIQDYRLIAIDLAGHGRSDWIQDSMGYPILGYVADLRQIVLSLGDPKIRLLGHSLGAGVCSLYAGCWPESVVKLGLIENLGPMADDAEHFPQAFRETVDANLEAEVRVSVRPLETWVRSRAQGAFPVPKQAAERLMSRSTRLTEEGLFQLAADPRLKQRTTRLTETQVRAALSAIEAPVMLISGEQGIKRSLTEERVSCVRQLAQLVLPGGHHLHMEPESVGMVAKAFNEFYA